LESVEIDALVERLSDGESAKYSNEPGHGFSSDAERTAWLEEITSSVHFFDGQFCLDVGAGTGMLTHLLAASVAPSGTIIAQDLSLKSLELNRQTKPVDVKTSIEFVHGNAHDESLFVSRFRSAFDIIAARQSVVIFQDPSRVFRLWRTLLKPGGVVVILDALWSRESWTGEWADLRDSLPLSCLQTLGTIPYLLEGAGFKVRENRFLEKVNDLLGEDGKNCPRFIVVAN
jgi:SAM-dependent methyltransferase